MVKSGSGPQIVVTDDAHANWMNSTDPKYQSGSRFDNNHPNNLYISGTDIRELEREAKVALKTHNTEKLKTIMFKVSVDILHESAHTGNFLKHKDYATREDGEDQGSVFERKAFGDSFSYNPSPGHQGDSYNNDRAADFLKTASFFQLYGTTLVGPSHLDHDIFRGGDQLSPSRGSGIDPHIDPRMHPNEEDQ